jgi:hypothetical protein
MCKYTIQDDCAPPSKNKIYNQNVNSWILARGYILFLLATVIKVQYSYLFLFFLLKYIHLFELAEHGFWFPPKQVKINPTIEFKSFALNKKHCCPVNLTQLIGQLHFICRELRFEPRSSHLSTLRVKFLVTRLLDQ